MKRKKTKAREIALQFLYQYDRRHDEALEYLDFFVRTSSKVSSVRKYANILINGCIQNIEKIDNMISSALKNWDLNRISSVDRTILRIACFEMEFLKNVPKAVAINEAIELARLYSTANSPAFVNGLLDQISSDSSTKSNVSRV